MKAKNLKASLGSIFVIATLGLLAGCSQTPTSTASSQATEPRISAEELRAYCPRAVLPDAEAFYTIYERGGEDDPSRIIYQVAIDKITRACRYDGGQIRMEVAVAGRVVPGSKFKPANLKLPLYVRAQRGEEVLYAKQHQFDVIAATHGQATQFIFKDETVHFEQPSARNVIVAVGLLQNKR